MFKRLMIVGMLYGAAAVAMDGMQHNLPDHLTVRIGQREGPTNVGRNLYAQCGTLRNMAEVADDGGIVPLDIEFDQWRAIVRCLKRPEGGRLEFMRNQHYTTPFLGQLLRTSNFLDAADLSQRLNDLLTERAQAMGERDMIGMQDQWFLHAEVPDTQAIAYRSLQPEVKQYIVEQRVNRHIEMPIENRRAFIAAVSAGGRYVAMQVNDMASVVSLYDTQTGRYLFNFAGLGNNERTAVAFSADGGRMYIAVDHQGAATLFTVDTATGRELPALYFRGAAMADDQPNVHLITQDATKLIRYHAPVRTLQVYDVATQALLWHMQFDAHDEMRVTYDHQAVWSYNEEQHTVSTYDMQTGAERGRYNNINDAPLDVSSDGRFGAFLTFNEQAEIVMQFEVKDLQNGQVVQVIPAPDEHANVYFLRNRMVEEQAAGTTMRDVRNGGIPLHCENGWKTFNTDGSLFAIIDPQRAGLYYYDMQHFNQIHNQLQHLTVAQAVLVNNLYNAHQEHRALDFAAHQDLLPIYNLLPQEIRDIFNHDVLLPEVAAPAPAVHPAPVAPQRDLHAAQPARHRPAFIRGLHWARNNIINPAKGLVQRIWQNPYGKKAAIASAALATGVAGWKVMRWAIRLGREKAKLGFALYNRVFQKQ